MLKRALERASELGASDLHLHSGSPLLMRKDGRLQAMPGHDEPVAPDAAAREVGALMGEERWQEFLLQREMDLACALPGVGRFRVNAYMQQRGTDIVFRLLPDEPPTLQDLGLPERLAEMTSFRTGIVLCTGPTGCGKSTTLAALLNLVVQSRKEHIITIEDPIEFIYSKGVGLVNQRQIGAHTESFARALRAALREDPDVIGITELRDPETISLALSAAETGHLVLGSLHTASAMQTVTRIINAFPSDQQPQVRVMLSESLRVVISQCLVARADGQGRVPALEVLVITPAVSNLIREDKTFQLPSVMQMGRAHGMQLLDDSLEQLVRDGVVEAAEARVHAVNPARFQ
jgi:twitching motility protein PilT